MEGAFRMNNHNKALFLTKRSLCILLALALVLMITPVVALAENEGEQAATPIETLSSEEPATKKQTRQTPVSKDTLLLEGYSVTYLGNGEYQFDITLTNTSGQDVHFGSAINNDLDGNWIELRPEISLTGIDLKFSEEEIGNILEGLSGGRDLEPGTSVSLSRTVTLSIASSASAGFVIFVPELWYMNNELHSWKNNPEKCWQLPYADVSGFLTEAELNGDASLLESLIQTLLSSDNRSHIPVPSGAPLPAAYAERYDEMLLLDFEDLSAIGTGFLRYFSNVTELHLWGTGITEINGIAGMKNLQELDIDDNSITDLSPLKGLTNLKVISADGNDISDLSPLAGLTNLQQLSLSENDISDVSPLSGLVNLRELFVDNNRIADIAALDSLTSLLFLDVSNNLLTSVPLSPVQLARLVGFGFGGNAIGNLSFLSHMNITSPAILFHGQNQRNVIIDVPISGTTLVAQNPLQLPSSIVPTYTLQQGGQAEGNTLVWQNVQVGDTHTFTYSYENGTEMLEAGDPVFYGIKLGGSITLRATPESKIPQVGDSTDLEQLFALLLVSGVMIMSMVHYRRKKNYS